MPANTLKQLAVATALVTAAMTASTLTMSTFTFADQDPQGMLTHSQPSQPVQPVRVTGPASPARLHVGLSDLGARPVLPWFLTDLVDMVNRRAPLQDFVKKLWNGI